MSQAQDSETKMFRVLRNHEEQYSLWPAELEIPAGWNDVGKVDSEAACVAYVDQVWVDMRPLSLRKRMEQAQGS